MGISIGFGIGFGFGNWHLRQKLVAWNVCIFFVCYFCLYIYLYPYALYIPIEWTLGIVLVFRVCLYMAGLPLLI